MPRDGARTADARWRWCVSPGRALVSGGGGRFHLDGAILSAMVRRAGQNTGALFDLQGLEPMKIAAEQLMDELMALAAFSDSPAPAVTRVVFSPVDLIARAYVKQLCLAADLIVREDPVGNMFARWVGR